MDIRDIRMEIPDEVTVPNPTYKVKDLVSFLSSLDQESDVVWIGRDQLPVIFAQPLTGRSLYIFEAEQGS